jgi:hypothetical protein
MLCLMCLVLLVYRIRSYASCAPCLSSASDGSWQHDNSYLGNIIGPNDFFVRIKRPEQPFIAHVDPDGYTSLHVHPLNGCAA